MDIVGILFIVVALGFAAFAGYAVYSAIQEAKQVDVPERAEGEPEVGIQERLDILNKKPVE